MDGNPLVIIKKKEKKMNKELNLLAVKVMEQEKHSKERALERLSMIEDVCLIQGKHNLIKKVELARQYIQRNYC